MQCLTTSRNIHSPNNDQLKKKKKKGKSHQAGQAQPRISVQVFLLLCSSLAAYHPGLLFFFLRKEKKKEKEKSNSQRVTMQLRLISWFFITLNFMEYIGSQHASRVRRQGRSKCEEIYTLITSASSRGAPHLAGGFLSPPVPGRVSSAPALQAVSLSWRDEGDFSSASALLSHLTGMSRAGSGKTCVCSFIF